MKQRIAINGFGRIGRTVLRAWTARQSLHETVEIAAINEKFRKQRKLEGGGLVGAVALAAMMT